MDNLKAVCIIADVMNSRINQKDKQLKLITEELNTKFGESLITEFTIRSGDEIFGIVDDFEMGYRAFKELYYLSKQHKIPLYVGVGFGDIYNNSLGNPDQVNGPAIWSSADALTYTSNKLRKSISTIQALDKNFKFMFIVGENYEDSLIINYLLYFILEKIGKRTPRQMEVIRLVEEFPDLNYEEIGKKAGYENVNIKVNVSNLLIRGEYNIVKEAEQELLKLINIVNKSSYDRKS